jgi:hypothetical protein
MVPVSGLIIYSCPGSLCLACVLRNSCLTNVSPEKFSLRLLLHKLRGGITFDRVNVLERKSPFRIWLWSQAPGRKKLPFYFFEHYGAAEKRCVTFFKTLQISGKAKTPKTI